MISKKLLTVFCTIMLNLVALGYVNEDPESCLLHASKSETPDPKLGWLEFYKPVCKSSVLDVDYYARIYHGGSQETLSCRRNKDSINCSSVGGISMDCTLSPSEQIECKFNGYLSSGITNGLSSKLTCSTASKD